ncbi:hypothetical protein [Nocardia vaccinii]|uniref:hypothetical protein n=1 Tax=Nocardia vaccinii TaxID=1822 RepID=UPI00082EDC64|nr:hypothetical protein [Nocardia vaccinii]
MTANRWVSAGPCLAYSPEKDGKDIASLIGHAPIGVTITTDKERIYDLDADIVVYAGVRCPTTVAVARR